MSEDNLKAMSEKVNKTREVSARVSVSRKAGEAIL